MTAANERDALAIIQELYTLTEAMVQRTDDPDFLAESVERRQALMDEYDAYAKDHPELDKSSLKKLVSEILAMDEKINSSLIALKGVTKRKLMETKNRQRAMEYGSNTAAAGSFMNYSK